MKPHDASTVAVHGRTKVLWTGGNRTVDTSTASSGVFMLGLSVAGKAPFLGEEFVILARATVSVIVSWHICLQFGVHL